MANLSYGSISVPADNSSGPHTLSLVPTHIGGNTVYIDAVALKQLIQTLKEALRPRSPRRV